MRNERTTDHSPAHAAAPSPGHGDRGPGAFPRRPAVRFVLGFAVLMAAFTAFFYGYLTSSTIFERYLIWNARASAAVLRLLGENAVADGPRVVARFSVEIRHGCDAILPAGLFAMAVTAFPVRAWLKLQGMAVGVVFIIGLNLVRIISLYYAGVYWPAQFETIHIDVWQPAFIFFALLLWMLWAVWATRPQPIAGATTNGPG